MALTLPPCPCGQEHALSRETRRNLARTIKRRGELVEVRGYLVPRVWAFSHSVNQVTFPAVAALHGWKRAT